MVNIRDCGSLEAGSNPVGHPSLANGETTNDIQHTTDNGQLTTDNSLEVVVSSKLLVSCSQNAPVAQLDRASDFESAGRAFESPQARQKTVGSQESQVGSKRNERMRTPDPRGDIFWGKGFPPESLVGKGGIGGKP